MPVTDATPTPDQVGYLPADETTATINPPPIAWLEVPKASGYNLKISKTPDFGNPAIKVENHPWLLYTHTATLEPGTWYWRYAVIDSSGNASQWSKVRSFIVTSDLPKFPRPSYEEIAERVPREHPRMFVRPDSHAALRNSTTTATAAFDSILKSATAHLESRVMQEPARWTGGKWNKDEWSTYLQQAGPAVNIMETLAFAYLLTGDKKYGDVARTRLLEYASWDPLGTSSMKVNDEVGMPMLHGIARTYSWIHDVLSPEDRAVVQEHMRARGKETYARLSGKHFEQYAYRSHSGRMFHFLGEAGLAFYGEIPEAKQWLDYAITIFYGWYPIWGDPDGGWAEGLSYYSSYNTRITWWLELMERSLGLRGSDKPFYRNVGDFPLYVAPPGNPVAGFGDMSERDLRRIGGQPMAVYSRLRQNGTWQWYADQIDAQISRAPVGYLTSLRPTPDAELPTDVPLLKVFSGAGYALFNTDLFTPNSNIHLAMRSSPFGNVSHSHCDQNAIVLAAYGEPLLVNTGVREWYGSPFCKDYYWHTRSHNALLIEPQGQPRSPASKGEFIATGEVENLAWVVGGATAAYPDQATLVRRWAAVAHDEIVILLDEVQTTASQVQLLYHALAPFEPDDGGTQFLLQKADVQLHGYVFSTADISWNHTDKLPIMPGPDIELRPEWHLTAEISHLTTDKPLRVVTVLVPTKEGSRPLGSVYAETDDHIAKIEWESGTLKRRLSFDLEALKAGLH